MHIKAGTLFSEILREFSGAGREHKDFIGFDNCLFYCERACIGSYILCSVIIFLQYGLQAWIVLICDPDIAIALIVFQQDIILWGILLYERTLQHQGFKLRVGDDKVIVIDVGHHFPHLWQMILTLSEIRCHTVAEIFRLADIDYLFHFVFHYITAR